ncbi:hypothetical protein G9A89_023024 [Geosiphon pyriformis]|nr:hypothetical protein G9A89_023024 [Geosiphon pyriformis]
MEQIQMELCEMFPGRVRQITTLLNLMGKPKDQTPPALYIYGHTALGKTTVIQNLFKLALPPHHYSFLDCIVCFEPRMLFQHALNDLTMTRPTPANGYQSQKCLNLSDFVVKVAQCCNIGADAGETRYLIFDRAERLRDKTPDTLIPTLLKLRELTKQNICILFISNIPWEHFRTGASFYEPLLLPFPEYSKDILFLGGDLGFFRIFVSFVYDSFSINCKDLNQLLHLASLLYPKYIEPIEDGRARPSETAKLINYVEPYFKTAMDKLYLNEISSSEWSKKATDTEENLLITVSFSPNDDIPRFTKYLLIASFLASYNPPRLDKRYFSKGPEDRIPAYRKKANQGTPRNSSVLSKFDNRQKKYRQQLQGPAAFPVERLLAIFHSIVPDTDIDADVEIQTQISTLVTLRFLARGSSLDKLEVAKYKCNVSYEFIKKISSSLQFEIQHYLYDFE